MENHTSFGPNPNPKPAAEPNSRSHTKERITIRIDRDVLEWFRSLTPNARGYQSRINQALREYMQNGVKSTEEILRKVMREELHKNTEEV